MELVTRDSFTIEAAGCGPLARTNRKSLGLVVLDCTQFVGTMMSFTDSISKSLRNTTVCEVQPVRNYGTRYWPVHSTITPWVTAQFKSGILRL